MTITHFDRFAVLPKRCDCRNRENFVDEFGKERFESVVANDCQCKNCGSKNTAHVGTIWLDDDLFF